MLMAACAALLKLEESTLFTVPLPWSALVKFIYDRDTPLVEVSTAPSVVSWMVPPEPAVDPSPAGGGPRWAPPARVLRSMRRRVPGWPPPWALMSWNVGRDEPMLVLVRLSAVPLPELMLLPEPVT